MTETKDEFDEEEPVTAVETPVAIRTSRPPAPRSGVGEFTLPKTAKALERFAPWPSFRRKS